MFVRRTPLKVSLFEHHVLKVLRTKRSAAVMSSLLLLQTPDTDA